MQFMLFRVQLFQDRMMCYFDHKGLEPSGSVHCREQPSCVQSCLDVFIPQIQWQFYKQTDWLTDWLAVGSPIAAMITEYLRNHSPTAQHHILEDFSLHQDCLVNRDCAFRFICMFMLYIYWHEDIIFIVTGFEICACIFHKFDWFWHILACLAYVKAFSFWEDLWMLL
jgi:hypothetical protein